nr:reverse transcriptase [Tanacetum cinerariifolium]
QSAFIPGRLIQDCMIVANEAFHYIRNKKKGNQNVMALKLDLNKAFDRVEWDFLIQKYQSVTICLTFNRYCEASGKRINFSKSEVMFSPNTPMNEQIELCSRLGVRLMKQCSRYLGLPSIHRRNKGELLSLILENVLKKMQGWKSSLDKIDWHYESKGNYIVKSGYRQALIQKETCPTIFASSSSTPNKSFWKQIWNLKTLPKIKYLWWKACSNAPATHENLSLRGCEKFPASDPRMAELMAIRSACRLAITYGWHNATIESDSKIAISLASSEVEPPWALAVIAVDIKALASQLAMSFSRAKHECNLAAHCVAKMAFNSLDSFAWDVSFPDEITSIARSDII